MMPRECAERASALRARVFARCLNGQMDPCARWFNGARCEELGTQYERKQWDAWRRAASWLLLFAWYDDTAHGFASDVVPEPTIGERYPSRADLRAYACAIIAQAWGDGHRDELAARWRSLWSRWLNFSATDAHDGRSLLGHIAEGIYRVQLPEPSAPVNLAERALEGDELAARIGGWHAEALRRSSAEHSTCLHVIFRTIKRREWER